MGDDYAVVMLPDQTTDSPLASIYGPDLERFGRLFAAAPELLAALKRMTDTFRPFTMKPIGAPGSAARAEQDEQKAAHIDAVRAIAAAERGGAAPVDPPSPPHPDGIGLRADGRAQSQGARTPAARWREEGKPDPHDDRYDCERAKLLHGDMTDDEIANAVYLNNNDIGILTAAKERIRWLSRALSARG